MTFGLLLIYLYLRRVYGSWKHYCGVLMKSRVILVHTLGWDHHHQAQHYILGIIQ